MIHDDLGENGCLRPERICFDQLRRFAIIYITYIYTGYNIIYIYIIYIIIYIWHYIAVVLNSFRRLSKKLSRGLMFVAKTTYSVDLVSGCVSDTLPMGLQSQQDVWGAKPTRSYVALQQEHAWHSNMVGLNTNTMCLEFFGCATVNYWILQRI